MRALRASGLVGAVLAAAAAFAADSVPEAGRLLAWVRELTAPAMAGRASGTDGADRAAEYLAAHFRRIGLQPLGDGGTFLQRFAVLTRVELGGGNTLELTAPGRLPRRFVPAMDFLPFAFSESGAAAGAVVFAGYGITAPPLAYDDYAELDVRDKLVIVMTGEPREEDPRGPFRPPEHFHFTELRHKILNAREHGAAGVIVVEKPGHPDDTPRPLRGTTPAWGIFAISATRAVANALLGPAGLDLTALAGEIDRGLSSRSRLLPGVSARLRVALVRERGETANVVGLLPGTDAALRNEAVVVGAHFDHLGRGSPFSLSPSRADATHPGADDNASGTAVVAGLAEAFAQAGGTRRSLVFVTFSGEEAGLLGSTHYTRHAPVALERTIAMVNLDGVGRMREGRLYVMGVDTGVGLRSLVEEAAQGVDVTLALRGDGIGRSDHTAFFNHDRPVLFFFTGTHPDYHRPSDTWEKINAEGLRKVAEVTFRTVRALADGGQRPAFVRVPAAAPARRGGRGYGPYFGSVPDFAESQTPGVRLSGVRPGAPAERAGLRTGDVIVRFAGMTIRTLDDLVFALRSHRPGDTVEVVYLRDGTEHTAQATLEQRR